MARIAGRNGRIYANITSGGTPEPVTFLKSYDITFESEKFDVTAFGDTTKAYVAGLPDASGSYSGYYDDAGAQFYTAALDGVARKCYIYPSTSSTGTYFWGTAFFDFSISQAADGTVDVSGSFAAATPFAKVG